METLQGLVNAVEANSLDQSFSSNFCKVLRNQSQVGIALEVQQGAELDENLVGQLVHRHLDAVNVCDVVQEILGEISGSV